MTTWLLVGGYLAVVAVWACLLCRAYVRHGELPLWLIVAGVAICGTGLILAVRQP